MQKDPKRVLESLRIEEEDPLLHHRPRKFRKRKNELNQVSNTAILSLCLVTGLSSGVGSAFANSLDGNTQNKAPLDEPPSKVEQDKNIELPQMKAPQTKSSEIIPNNPPLDEPASKTTKQPDNSENNHTHIEKGKSETSESQKKETAGSKQNKEQTNQTDKTQNETDQQEKTSKNKQTTKPIENEKSTQSHSSSGKHQQSKEKSVTPPANSNHESNKQSELEKTKEKESNTESNQTEQSDILLPQTEEGGELPKTAGNDLNQAALGAGVALAGAALLRRKREKSQ